MHLRMLAMSVLTFCLGCSQPIDVVASKYVKTAQLNAARGGELSVSAQDSSELAGVVLRVPAGAVASDLEVTLERGRAPLIASADLSAGPVALWGPPGTRFAKEVEMTLPYRLTGAQTTGGLFVQVQEDDGSRFVIEREKLEIDAIGQLVTFKVSGFSGYQPGSATATCTATSCTQGKVCVQGSCQLCTTSSQCAGAESCVSGACTPTVVPPGCTSNAQCSNGQVCVSGGCQPPTGCSSTSPCANAELCVLGTCKPCGAGAACPGALTCTSGVCQDCSSGRCFTPCNASSQCPSPQVCGSNGSCGVPACPSGETYCVASCVNVKTSGQHCGGCNLACATGSSCADGKCKVTCATSANCASGEVCYSGVCQIIPCEPARPCPGSLTCSGGWCT